MFFVDAAHNIEITSGFGDLSEVSYCENSEALKKTLNVRSKFDDALKFVCESVEILEGNIVSLFIIIPLDSI